jgi:hypothetical protein
MQSHKRGPLVVLSVAFLLLLSLYLCLAMEGSESYWRHAPYSGEIGDPGVENPWDNTGTPPDYPGGGQLPYPGTIGDHGVNNPGGPYGSGCKYERGGWLCSDPHHT